MDMSSVFTWDAIDAGRQLSADRIDRMLSKGPDTAPHLRYALAHHRLEGAEAAARRGDAATFAWYRKPNSADFDHHLVMVDTTQVLLLCPTPADMLSTSISETGHYIIRGDTPIAESYQRLLVTDALACVRNVELEPLAHHSAPIICLLEQRTLHETLHSWSITRLPGTLFTEHVGDRWVLGRDLIHEAGHNWLNDALVYSRTKIPEDVTFYSPWRKAQRPAFGFIHACWSFALTAMYTVKALAQVNDEKIRAFLIAYLDQQKNLFDHAFGDIDTALGLIVNTELRTRIAFVIGAAHDHLSVRSESDAAALTRAP